MPVFVRKATFKLPKDVKAPVILIGPGTGYAPFRGFLQEREYLLKSKKQELGECMLFFGCRKEEHDYIYRDEMENALSEKVITSLDVAFSRDDPKKKVYVQDKIQMKAKDVYKILEAQTARCTCAETPSTCPGMSTEPCCKYYNAKANTRYTKPRKSFVD